MLKFAVILSLGSLLMPFLPTPAWSWCPPVYSPFRDRSVDYWLPWRSDWHGVNRCMEQNRNRYKL